MDVNSAASADTCDDLLGVGPPPKPLQASSDSISAASSGVTEYTCILINQQPSDLLYQKLPPLKSQVVKLEPPSGSNFNNLTISWQSSNRSYDQVPPPNSKILYPEVGSGVGWTDLRYEPMLRITLYRVDNSNPTLSNIANNARTFFLYPSSVASASLQVNPPPNNGLLADASCTPPPTPNDFHCRATFTQLSNTDYLFMRITPIYLQADVRIEGVMNPGNRPAQFINAQAIVDATAKSNESVRRLAARVDTSSLAGSAQVNISPSEDAMPEFAVRSAATLCKQLDVSGGNVTTMFSVLCNLTLP